MADKIKYRVVRRHEGDRLYEEGETREGTKAELGHLVPHVLVEDGVAAKAEEAPLNKSEGDSPANKAEPDANENKAEPDEDQVAKFDHDNDGRVGGSKPKSKKEFRK
jgi:hypothetical protein